MFIHSFVLCMVMGCQKHSMTGFVYSSVRIIIRLLAWSSRDNFLSPVKYLQIVPNSSGLFGVNKLHK
jgi:hypothetical protein